MTKLNVQKAILHAKRPVLEANFSQHNFGRFFWFLFQSTQNHQHLGYRGNGDIIWPMFYKQLYFESHVKSVL